MSHLSKEISDIQHKMVLDFDRDQQTELFSEDGVWEFPLTKQAGHGLLKYDERVIHDTADPEVIVVEFDLHGEGSHTGEKYRRSYIQVLRVHEDTIVSLRDYFN